MSGAGAIWVGSDGGESITRIDPATDRIAAGPILTGDYALDALAASSGGAFVGDGMRWLDAETNRIGPRALAGRCSELSVAGDSSGFVWYLSTDSSAGCSMLAKLDSTTGRVVRTWPFPSAPGKATVFPGDGQIWISDETSNPPMLDRLDTRTGRRQPIARIRSSDSVAVGDGVIGVLSWGSAPPTLTRLDEHTRRKLGTTELIEINAGVSPSIAEGSGRFWLVIDGRQSKLVAYDARTGKPTGAPLVLRDQGAPIYAFGALWWAGDDRVLRIAPR